MFREMRRTKQLLSPAETVEILQACPYGVLAVHGDQGYPYAVPLSYTYHDGRLFLHFALDGHKLDSILKDERVSFAVVETAKVVPEAFTTHYRTTIVFGRMKLLTEVGEKIKALECILEKYSPDYLPAGLAQIEKDLDRFCAAELKIEHMTGKVSLALLKNTQ